MEPSLKEEQKIRLKEVCSDCGKEVASSHNGSLTGWIFGDRRCRCASNNQPVANEEAPVESIPQILNDRYKIQAVLGEGGVGTVYKVLDQELNKTFAAKVLHAKFVQDKAVTKRFEQEVKAASILTNPHLVAIYDQGRTNDGAPFFLMDYLDGKNLEEVINQEVFLEPSRTADVALQICEAVAHAHAKGIVHRDIKPSNIILVTNEEGDDFVKVVDFGIAKVVSKNIEATGATTSKLTKEGEVFGSPAYMSPEQCMGKKADVRSDIYAIGCVMYEMLTGKPPFMGDNALETLMKHLNEVPPEFSKVAPTLEVPTGISNIVLNALEKDPEQRYQNAAELMKDLELLRDGKIPARRKIATRKPKKLGLGKMAVGAAAAIAVVVGGFSFMLNSRPDFNKFDANAVAAYSQGHMKESAQWEAKAALAAEKEGASPHDLLDIYEHAGSLFGRFDLDQAVPYYTKAAAVCRSLDLPEREITNLQWLAAYHYGKKEYARAAAAYQRIAECQRTAYGANNKNAAIAAQQAAACRQLEKEANHAPGAAAH